MGSVPIYEAIVRSVRTRGASEKMTGDEMLDAIRLHGEDGISFVTVHCGVTISAIEHLKKSGEFAE